MYLEGLYAATSTIKVLFLENKTKRINCKCMDDDFDTPIETG